MKYLLSIPILIAFSLLLSACASKGSVEIKCDDFYESANKADSIEVATGDQFTVSLCSNASTGYQWVETADISDPGVIEQTGHEYILAPEKDKPAPPGTPGSEMWIFNALKEGNSTISFEYGQPWDGGEKAAWTFVLSVVVK